MVIVSTTFILNKNGRIKKKKSLIPQSETMHLHTDRERVEGCYITRDGWLIRRAAVMMTEG